MGRRRIARDYLLFGLLCAFLIAVWWWLVPRDQLGDHWRSLVFTFMFGSLVGMSEIASRYRDEPLRAVASPFGLIYAVVNGSFSIAAAFIILRFSSTFPGIATDGVLLRLDASTGKVEWKAALQEALEIKNPIFGQSCSPLVFDGS